MKLGDYFEHSTVWNSLREDQKDKLESDWDEGNGTYFGVNVETLFDFFNECVYSNLDLLTNGGRVFELVRAETKLPSELLGLTMGYLTSQSPHKSVGLLVKSFGIWDKCYAYPFKWLFKHMGVDVNVYKNDAHLGKKTRGGCESCGYGGEDVVYRELPANPYNVIVWTNDKETTESFETRKHWMVNARFYGNSPSHAHHRSTAYCGKKKVLESNTFVVTTIYVPEKVVYFILELFPMFNEMGMKIRFRLQLEPDSDSDDGYY
jgi:hypothetical protein